MTVQTFPSPTLWPLELSVVLRLGLRSSPDEVLAEAMDHFLNAHPDLGLEVALELYRQEQVTLSRAAEISGLTRWDFQARLREHGLSVAVQVEPPEELDAALQAFRASAAT
jgi:predicted HTH domain antitoxin